jgi:hypothetical protein
VILAKGQATRFGAKSLSARGGDYASGTPARDFFGSSVPKDAVLCHRIGVTLARQKRDEGRRSFSANAARVCLSFVLDC